MDKLSIVIPAYITSEKIKAKFVKLIADLNKQRSDWKEELVQIIVIDDGSPVEIDFEGRIAGDCFIQTKNKGVSAARNLGIMLARGNIIAFCDADDGVEPDYIQTIFEVFAYFPGAEAAVFGTNKKENPNLAHKLPALAVWAYAFVRNSIGVELFDEEKQAGEDYDWLNRVLKRDRLVAIPKTIYKYDTEVNPDSLSKRYNRGDFDGPF